MCYKHEWTMVTSTPVSSQRVLYYGPLTRDLCSLVPPAPSSGPHPFRHMEIRPWLFGLLSTIGRGQKAQCRSFITLGPEDFASAFCYVSANSSGNMKDSQSLWLKRILGSRTLWLKDI